MAELLDEAIKELDRRIADFRSQKATYTQQGATFFARACESWMADLERYREVLVRRRG